MSGSIASLGNDKSAVTVVLQVHISSQKAPAKAPKGLGVSEALLANFLVGEGDHESHFKE